MSELKRIYKMTKRLLLREKPTITKLWIEATDKCNSRCKTCSIWTLSEDEHENILTPEKIWDVLTDPVFKDVDYIINSGGEPTMRDDLLEFLQAEHIALPQATIQLSTNGLQPTKVAWVVTTLLERHPDLKMDIGTSLEGIGEVHDEARGVEGNYIKVLEMLEYLEKLQEVFGKDRLNVGFGTVLTENTIGQIKALEAFAEQRGIGMLLQWYNQSPFYSNTVKRAPNDTTQEIYDAVEKADYTILSDLWCGHIKGEPVKYNCMALQSFCVIKCNGDIVPCLTLWNHKMGNVQDNAPSNILKRKGGIMCIDKCLNSWATYWSFEADPMQYVRYFVRHPIKLVKKICG